MWKNEFPFELYENRCSTHRIAIAIAHLFLQMNLNATECDVSLRKEQNVVQSPPKDRPEIILTARCPYFTESNFINQENLNYTTIYGSFISRTDRINFSITRLLRDIDIKSYVFYT